MGALERIGRGIDATVGAFSPSRGFKRQVARWASEYALGGYEGGKTNRSTRDWLPGDGSADADILGDLPRLRNRSRDLNRNDGFAAGITQTMVTNIVGTGIRPQSKIDPKELGLTQEAAEMRRREAERAFHRWEPYSDAADRVDWLEMQILILSQILENGEALLTRQMIDEPRRPYSFCWQMAESDRLATPLDKARDGNIRGGIEIGSRGQPLAYWIANSHPGDMTISMHVSTQSSKDFTRIPAYDEDGRPNVLHLYWTKRPGQSRGVPFFAPVLTLFRHMAGYIEAEVMATRLAACISMFIKTTDPMAAALARGTSADASGNRVEKMQPAMVKYLGPNEDIATFNPDRPNTQFGPFMDSMIEFLSGGLGLPRELVTKNFGQLNYSSARAALLQAYRFFRVWQAWLDRKACKPTYDLVLEEAYLRGYFEVPDFYSRQAAWTSVQHIAPGWEWVDPLKEAKASRESLEGDLTSEVREAASRGQDWEAILEEKARVKQKREELGLPDPYSKQSSSSGNGRPPNLSILPVGKTIIGEAMRRT